MIYHPKLDLKLSNKFDQYSALYTHYEVMGSKMVVKVINDSSSVNALAALAPSTSTINPGFSVLTEQKYSQNKYLNNSTGGHNLAYMKKYMSPRKLLGRQTNSLNYAAAVSSNPVNQTYWIVSGQALDGISSTSLHIFVRITYYCKFWNRVQLGQS